MTISHENFESIVFDEQAKGPDTDDFEDLEEDGWIIVINEGLAEPIDEFMEIDIGDYYDPVQSRNTNTDEAHYSGGDYIGMALIATYAVFVVYFGIFNWQPE